jgi:hypothetical protein
MNLSRAERSVQDAMDKVTQAQGDLGQAAAYLDSHLATSVEETRQALKEVQSRISGIIRDIQAASPAGR